MSKIADKKQNTNVILLLLTFFLLLLFLASFVLGRFDVPFIEVLRILCNAMLEKLHIGTLEKTWAKTMEIAVLNIRLPRILLACLVGASLGVAGTTFQSVFRNPMASPDLLGASSGAGFGAALAILLGLSSNGVTVFAFTVSLLTVLIVYMIGSRVRGNRVTTILLSGIMVSSLFSSATSYLKLVADPSDQLPAITYWLMGSLSGVNQHEVTFALIPMMIGVVPLLLLRWKINLLTLGDDVARSMGVQTDRLRYFAILCATLLTAASVSVSGMIGWVGLIIPHIARKLVGNDCRRLLPCSTILGAIFLLLVDNISRNLLAVEIPIGILTAFVGAPFFLYLMLKKEAIV